MEKSTRHTPILLLPSIIFVNKSAKAVVENLSGILYSTLPALIVAGTCYLLINSFLKGEQKKIALPIRLQAYERICLLLERIHPPQLLTRVGGGKLSAKELHGVLLQTVRDEYNHNLSQQLYMSQEAWNSTQSAVEKTLLLINESADSLPAKAKGSALVQRLVENTVSQKFNIIDMALERLKKEVADIF